MRSVRVQLGDRSYAIRIGANALEEIGKVSLQHFAGGRALVVTDNNVAALYAEKTLELLGRAGVVASWMRIPAGEASKSLRQLSRILDKMASLRLDRGCGVVALGGGVVGDVAGFAAAIFLRGIPYIQVPTTLLAQVDSAVGGKTAIDHKRGKNLVGAFHQPAAVVSDTSALKTLPEREFLAGLAEVVKHAAIADRRLFSFLEKNGRRILERSGSVMEPVVASNCRIKAKVVERDEREAGLREILNYGHTLGHAVEALAGYSSRLLHGEAVAIGMAAASRISCEMGCCAPGDAERLIALLDRFGLPTKMEEPPKLPVLKRQVASDKKNAPGKSALRLDAQDRRGGIGRGGPASAVAGRPRRFVMRRRLLFVDAPGRVFYDSPSAFARA